MVLEQAVQHYLLAHPTATYQQAQRYAEEFYPQQKEEFVRCWLTQQTKVADFAEHAERILPEDKGH